MRSRIYENVFVSSILKEKEMAAYWGNILTFFLTDYIETLSNFSNGANFVL